jgi:hypothetical protein
MSNDNGWDFFQNEFLKPHQIKDPGIAGMHGKYQKNLYLEYNI